MTPEGAVIARLQAIGAVTALVSSRIYQLVLPQTPVLPAVRVQLISEPMVDNVDGQAAYVRARVQVDAYAGVASGSDPYAAAVALAEAIHGNGVRPSPTGLHNWRGTLSGYRVIGMRRIDRGVMYEAGELRLVRVRQDYQVFAEA